MIKTKSRLQSDTFADIVNHLRFHVFHHGLVTLDQNWKEATTRPTFNRLYLVREGEGKVVFDGQEIILKKNRAYFFPLNRDISFSCDGHLEKFFIHFHLTLHGLFDVFEIYGAHLQSREIDPELFSHLETFIESDIKQILSFREVLLRTILSFVGREDPQAGTKILLSRKYRPILDHIDKHLSIDLSLHDLAVEMNVTPAYLSSSFKHDTGKNLKRLIIERIVHRVGADLISTDKKIRRIADELGFKDEMYFSKFFKRETGQSPKDYRSLHTLREPGRL